MNFDDTTINGFFDELDSIEKQAALGAILKSLGGGLKAGWGRAMASGATGALGGAGQGFSRVGKALVNPRGVQWRSLGSGIGQAAPVLGAGAGIAGTGYLMGRLAS